MTQQLSGAQRHWTEADIPDLSGRTAVVTGANTGLGLQTSRVLAARGAHVVLACRDLDKAGHAASQIAAASPGASTSTLRLDLTSQSCVRSAAGEIRARFPHLDLLINNAGVMEVPCQRTEEGFELTLATNHLGPFALTGLLLDRRLRAAGTGVIALACHPGVVYTDLFATRSRRQQFLLSRPCGSSTSGPCRTPGWARCQRCARRPTRPRGAVSITARTGTACAAGSTPVARRS